MHTFKIGVYPPAILPMLAVYSTFYPSLPSMCLIDLDNNVPFYLSVSLAMEAMGDITASAEVSRVAVEGEEFESRIQGGVLVSILLRGSAFSRLIIM